MPAPGLGRILSVDEMPGLRAGFTRNVKVYSSADRTVDQGCLPGRTYNETITLVLSIAMDGTVLPPMVIHANRGLGGDEVGPAHLPESITGNPDHSHFVQRKVVGSIVTSSLPFVGESDLFSDIPSPLFCFRMDTAPACRLQSPTTFARSTFFYF